MKMFKLEITTQDLVRVSGMSYDKIVKDLERKHVCLDCLEAILVWAGRFATVKIRQEMFNFGMSILEYNPYVEGSEEALRARLSSTKPAEGDSASDKRKSSRRSPRSPKE
jgi:hypothetical protein